VTPIAAATAWRTNGEMIADVARLGYLHQEWRTLDPTWGRGTWWTKWRPNDLVAHDKYTLDGIDFRHLPYEDASFAAIVFDPPYQATGGRKTSTIKAMHDRYGMDCDDTRTPAKVQATIDGGLTEMRRLAEPRGFVLAKCAIGVTGGRLRPHTHATYNHAMDLGFEYVDELELLHGPTPQSQKTQRHARQWRSTLFVFRAPRR
jgi:hypothetical protein